MLRMVVNILNNHLLWLFYYFDFFYKSAPVGYVVAGGRDGSVSLASSTYPSSWSGWSWYQWGWWWSCDQDKKNINILQVNQQNHMVANKFDPRMDPVVVQVSLVIIAIITNSDSDIVIAIIVPVLMAKRQCWNFPIGGGFPRNSMRPRVVGLTLQNGPSLGFYACASEKCQFSFLEWDS